MLRTRSSCLTLFHTMINAMIETKKKGKYVFRMLLASIRSWVGSGSLPPRS